MPHHDRRVDGPSGYLSLIMSLSLLVGLFLMVVPGPDEQMLADAVQKGADAIVAMQAGETKSEWAYEGVYRVAGGIPFGYRIGGTAICGEALLRTPGFGTSDVRRDAIRKATEFVCSGITEPLLQVTTYTGGYDVRAWASCYGARFLLALKEHAAVPSGLEAQVEQALEWYIDSLQKFEIPSTGGWNYARSPGAETPCATSGFMTPVCLQTLYQAKAQGYKVDSEIVSRGLSALERCRTRDGNFVYATVKQANEPARTIPGAVGRMVAGETALYLAGRSSQANLKRAIEDFIRYWPELEKRRAKNGTHLPPYGVAPYYFWFAHYHAAQAIELLSPEDRPRLRRALNWLLWLTRTNEGTWNDRVFPRSAAYGSAMAIMSISMPESFAPKNWN